MSLEQWTAVDRYVTELLLPPDPVLDAALKASADAGLPEIQVTPAQGRLLQLLARLRGARRILEVGTLGGYSTIWLARALPPGGRLVTLELDPKHAAVARANLARAGLTAMVDLRIGPALASLQQLAVENGGPFDLIFLDADKAGLADYFQRAVRLSRPGTAIVADNVVRKGAVIDADSDDAGIQGVRRLLAAMAAEPRVSTTVIQTVGSKGYDGFALAVVAANA